MFETLEDSRGDALNVVKSFSGGEAMEQIQTYKLFNHLKKNPGCLSTGITNTNVTKIYKITHEDCCQPIHDICKAVGFVTMQIFSEKLGLELHSVPHLLTINQKELREYRELKEHCEPSISQIIAGTTQKQNSNHSGSHQVH